jgi:hypothetical protein
MKKLLLSFVASISFLTINAQCNELFISEYVDGTGNDKALEIYNPTMNTIDLNGYTIHRYSNGSTTSTAGGVLTLSGTIGSGFTFVIVNGQTTGSTSSPAASPALQAMANLLDGPYPAPTYMNGDDALTLEKNGVKVDIFGKIGEDPGVSWTNQPPYTDVAGAYITKDHTLQRKASVMQGVTVNPSQFNALAQWDTLPKNTWTGLTWHSCACPVGIKEIDNNFAVIIYPNPANAGNVNISSTELIKTVQIFNVVGQQVFSQKINGSSKSLSVQTDLLSKGVYTVKVVFENDKSTVTKLSGVFLFPLPNEILFFVSLFCFFLFHNIRSKWRNKRCY